MLASDVVSKVNGAWSGQPHRAPGSPYPEGSNHLLVDGSVLWIRVQRLYELTGWGNTNYYWYAYQDDLTTIPDSQLAALKFAP